MVDPATFPKSFGGGGRFGEVMRQKTKAQQGNGVVMEVQRGLWQEAEAKELRREMRF